MKSTSLRRTALAALALAPVLAACGFDAQTDQVYQPAEGVLNRDADVDVLNAVIVSGQDGSGTLVASLVNNDVTQANALVSVTGPAITVPEDALTAEDADITIPADGVLNLATDGIVTVTGDSVVAGRVVEVTLTFANGDAVTIKPVVVRADGDYADIKVPATDDSTDGSSDSTETEDEGSGH